MDETIKEYLNNRGCNQNEVRARDQYPENEIIDCPGVRDGASDKTHIQP